MATRFFGDLMSTLFARSSGMWSRTNKRPVTELCDELLSGVGEVSGRRIAREILAAYRQMDEAERVTFFRYLTEKLDIQPDVLEKAAKDYAKTSDRKHLAAVIRAAEPKRQEFLRRINQAPGATGELVRMRLDLLAMTKTHPDFERADLDFAHLFNAWFNRGFLVLRRMDWGTPANILEKIIEYEAVHAINDWDDLRRRLLPPDRRCFAFFHPAMPDEPLIFVEVALTKEIPGSIQDVLADKRAPLDPAKATTAVFYSISNCQDGLRGISFGNSLIKHVVEELSHELPHLQNFVTLSPIPGFGAWLKAEESAGHKEAAALLAATGIGASALEPLAVSARRLAAYYLLEAKNPAGFPQDPVARFHLGNGALIHEVHALADVSKNGLRSSCGVMVNYLYELKSVEPNHETFATQKQINASRTVKALAKAAQGEKEKRVEV